MRYEFTLTGVSAMLMHFDDVEWGDEMTQWRLDPSNTKKKGEGSGDDRRPVFTWIGYCYHDGQHLALPGVNLSSCFKKAGSRVPMGKNKTCKELAVSGIFIEQEFLTFKNGGKQVPVGPIHALRDEPVFTKHCEAAKGMGFSLFVKRAAIGPSKHVRVRPRFDHWTVSGSLEVMAHEISEQVLRDVFTQAGRVGLGDWRPGSPKSPGPYGMFSASLKKVA